jgi:hypothetical protein
MDYFRRNPFDRGHMMQLETLVDMRLFENDRVSLDSGVDIVFDAQVSSQCPAFWLAVLSQLGACFLFVRLGDFKIYAV